MFEFIFKVWLTAMLFTIPLIWIEDALKYRNQVYIWFVLILVLGFDIGLLFVMGIMKIWGIE